MTEPGSVPIGDPLAFFLTWTAYGSWLSGDERGWVEKPGNVMAPDPERKSQATERMHETGVTFDREQRDLVERTVADHCTKRGWHLHAVKCRTQHVHVVVTAPDRTPEDVRDQLKAWCTRRLKELARSRTQDKASQRERRVRSKWWTEGGSRRRLYGDASLAAAIRYVIEDQDRPR
jgi:REP element-mobilizing transposase RayT